MSEEVTGLALQLGRRPALQWVTHVEQAAEMSSTAPTLIVIEPKQRPSDFEGAHRMFASALLKMACVQLLEEQAGKPRARGRSGPIQRLENFEAVVGAYTDHIARAKGRQPVKPKVMLIEPHRAPNVYLSHQEASLAEKLRQALDFLEQVAGPSLSSQSPPSESDDDTQLQLARERRDQLLAQEKWFNAPQVHQQQGGDPHAQGANNTASRARRRGDLLGAWDGREYLHPQFQFDLETGRLMPEMKQVLKFLPKDRSGWRQTFWLFQRHRQLDGKRPADVFQKNPAAVIEAARSDFVLDDERW